MPEGLLYMAAEAYFKSLRIAGTEALLVKVYFWISDYSSVLDLSEWALLRIYASFLAWTKFWLWVW